MTIHMSTGVLKCVLVVIAIYYTMLGTPGLFRYCQPGICVSEMDG